MHSIYDILTFIQMYIHKNGVLMLIVMPNVKFTISLKRILSLKMIELIFHCVTGLLVVDYVLAIVKYQLSVVGIRILFFMIESIPFVIWRNSEVNFINHSNVSRFLK